MSIPHDPENEAALLGCMMLSPAIIADVAAVVAPAVFHLPANATLFRHMTGIAADGGDPDFLTLIGSLRAAGELEAVGGPAAISALTAATPSALGWRVHADALRLAAHRRAIIAAARRLEALAHDPGQPPESLASAVSGELEALTNGALGATDTAELARDGIKALLDDIDAAQRGERSVLRGNVRTGIDELDDACARFPRGSLVTIASDTSGGKTALACQIARREAEAGRGALIVSLEMARAQMSARLLASTSGVNLGRIIGNAPLCADDHARLMGGCEKLKSAPLWIWYPRRTPSAADCVTMLRAARAKDPRIELVVVDYLQLLAPRDDREGNRERQVAEMSATLKRAAVSLDCVVIALSQRNDDGRLRESRAIGHDSDIVLTIDGGPGEDGEDTGEREIEIAKNRQGKRGARIAVRFAGETQQFREDTSPRTRPQKKGRK